MTDKTGDKDDSIIRLLRVSDPRAPVMLYQYHYKAVYGYTKDFVRNPEDAKDIVQELLTAIWVKRHVLHLTKPLRSYLFRAAHNKAINHLRDIGRKKRMLGEAVNRSGSGKEVCSGDQEFEAKELEELIKKAMNLLPRKVKNRL